MTTRHDAVAAVLIGKCDHRNPDAFPCEATAAIEALREGAVDRANSVVSWSPATELIINAILGPPNEVPE